MTEEGTPGPTVSRRRLLGGALAGGAALATGGLLGGCGARRDTVRVATDDRWRQFAGTTINFVSENTPPSEAIAADLRPFTELTGIQVNVVQLELSALVQKVALDLASGQAQYHVIYADPYQVLAPYAKGLVDLREFTGDPSLPRGADFADFVPLQMDAAGRFQDADRVFALPYDCPTMVWNYRADLFETHHDRIAQDLGFDPTPGPHLTWEQYFQIARWFNEKTHEVPFGTGHQAKQHDSLQCDFSNVLWAYGGDYFAQGGDRLGRLGAVDPGPCRLTDQRAVDAAAFYQRLVGVADPGSRTWDWDGLGAAFRAGRVAMCPNWHENATKNEKALPGRVGYALLPRGPVRSANNYGGTGIGVNANALPNERKAAWLFVAWATARQTQLRNLRSEAGATPTLTSIYTEPEVKAAEHRPTAMPIMLAGQAVLAAWQPENSGLRPKIPMWNECDTTVYTQLSRMLAGDAAPADAMGEASRRIDRITARGWVS
jgi:multiple sugar transport system substrate-binding protein